MGKGIRKSAGTERIPGRMLERRGLEKERDQEECRKERDTKESAVSGKRFIREGDREECHEVTGKEF